MLTSAFMELDISEGKKLEGYVLFIDRIIYGRIPAPRTGGVIALTSA